MTVCAPGELVGRDGELSAMSDLVAALCRREGPRLVVEGEAGIGKTRLVAALSAAARDAGVAVFRGGAHPFEATRPFGPIADALDLRRRSPDPRRAAIGRLLAGQHDAHEPAPHQDVRHRVIEEIVDLIETWTDVEPAVLVLEDLHWADASTVLALRSMAYRLACAPVLLAVTLRPSPRSPELAQLVAELVAMGATAVALAPLPADQAEALVRSEVGADPGPNLRRLVGKAEGNPLWVIGRCQRTG